MQTTFIYALSFNDEIKYIGKANNPIARFARHMRFCKSATKKHEWVKALKEKGEKPTLEILDEVPFDEWAFWEQHYISLFQSWGFNLLNGDRGGYGCGILGKEARDKIKAYAATRTYSPETRAKISAAKKGVKLTDEQKKNMGKHLIGRKLPEEHKKNISKGLKGKIRSEEHCKNISKAKIGKRHTDKSKAIIREARKGRKHSEETLQKMRGRKVSEESKAKMRLASKLRPPISEETRRKMSEASKRKHSDATRLKMKQSHIGKAHPEETKEKMRLAWVKRKLQKQVL